MDPQWIVDLLMKVGGPSGERMLALTHALPRGLFDRLGRLAFQQTIRLAASRSPFYRKQFALHGFDVKRVSRPEDLGDFFLTPDELRQTRPEDLLCGKPDLAIESSGTSGHITRIFLSRRELERSTRQGIFLKALYGLSGDDRVVSTLDYAFGLGGLLVERILPYWRVFGMAVGRVDPLEVYRRMPLYRFNVVISDPFWLSRLTEIAQEEGRPYPLKLLIGGGEGVTARARAEMEAFWESPLCMTYASTEAATLLGFECLHRNGYHLNELDFYVEIAEPDSEGYGEVVITTLNRSVMPLIRYRTRDVARFIEGSCPCGLSLKRLSAIRGRVDELVACVWGNVHPHFFEGLLRSIPGVADDWQVALLERGLKPTFQFRLELQDEGTRCDEVAARILKEIEIRHPLAWTAYLQRMVDLDFVFLPKGSLRVGRKLLRLVDERQDGEASQWVERMGTRVTVTSPSARTSFSPSSGRGLQAEQA